MTGSRLAGRSAEVLASGRRADLPAQRSPRGAVRRTPVVLPLGWAEGRRLLLHPVLLGGLAITAISLVPVPRGPGAAFSFVTGGGAPGLWLPPAVFFAANLSASRERRSGTGELSAGAPVTRASRTAAQCAAALVPVAVTLLVVLLGALRFQGAGVLTPSPTPAELTLLPLGVLGGAVLGVMVARWLPWPGAAIVVFVGLVAVSVSLSDGASAWWISYIELVEWENHELTDRRIAGSAPWHAAYLLGLSVMAAIGSLLRDVTRRGPLLVVGAAVTLATAGAGLAQLP